MPQPELRTLLRHIQRLTGTSADGVLTDRDLLQRFVRQCEEDAFAALVQRHGALVLNVGRRLLHSEQDAEDVFQATFLLLARKASTVQWRDTVGPWLHSVALRLAQKLRTTQARREQHERLAAESRPSSFVEDPSWREVCVALEEEVARLPERYRNPLLLCCWEGKSRDEAAQHLGWSLGTVKARLERGRDLLRRRLGRRGVVLSAGLLALSVASVGVPESLAGATVRAARVAVGTLPEAVERLVAMGTTMLGTAKWKIALAITLGLLTVGFGLGLSSYLARPAPSTEIAAKPEAPPDAEKAAPELLPPPKGEEPVPIVRVDTDGDPLPQEAIRRLGTARWRMTDALQSLACSEDGKRLATASRSGLVQVWDTATGKVLRELKMGQVGQVAISSDGEVVAAAVDTDNPGVGGIYIWPEGKKEATRFFKVSDRVYSLLLDGNRLWVGGREGIYCWDVEKSLRIIEHKFVKPDRVWAMAVSTGAPGLLAAGTTSGLRLYDEKGRELDASSYWGDESTNAVAFAPDGKSVAVGTDGGTLYIWDIADQRLKSRASSLLNQSEGVLSLAYTANGKSLVAAGRGTFIMASAETGKGFAGVPIDTRGATLEPAPSTNRLVLSSDGSRFFGQLCVKGRKQCHQLGAWDVPSGKENPPLAGHDSPVRNMVFQGDGSLLSLAEDGSVIRWDRKGNEALSRRPQWLQFNQFSLTEGGGMHVFGSILRADPRRGQRNDSWIIDIRGLLTNEPLIRVPEQELPNLRAALSLDGNTLVVARPETLTFHRLTTKEEAKVDTGLPSVPGLVFSPDGRRLALTNRRDTQIWSVTKMDKLCRLAKIVCAGPLEFSLDGKQVAVCSGDNVITLADADTGTRQGEIRLDASDIHALAFGPWPNLLTVATDKGVHILDTRTGKEVVHLNGGQGAVYSLAYSLDQGLLATGGADTTVLLWDTIPILARTTVAEQNDLPKDQALLWNDLGSADALRGVTALRAFRAEGEKSVALLQERFLTPDKPFGSDAQRRLIVQLEHADYKVRASAFAEVKKNPRVAEPVLREAYRNTTDEIFRLRLRTFLNELESEDLIVALNERLRERRVVFLLEMMASPEARKLLTTLAHEAKSEHLRSAASAALERMKPDDKRN
jgi:RNA polymerase sigma factor (sigma-70 family)